MAVIAIDFDHTLVEGSEWKPGAKNAVRLMREKGHKVIIHSCNEVKWIRKLLNEAGLVVDSVWGESPADLGKKPLADIYIDDKGYRFEGNWSGTVHNILSLVAGLDNRKW